MNRDERIKVFEDTFSRTKEYTKALEGCEVIKEDTILEKTFKAKDVKVVKGTTFDIARNYKDSRVCVLNFASATNPGGGVKKGSSAQEECLCRESSLYMSLNTKYFWDNYYSYHRNLNNCLYTNRLTFVPNVKIIKDGNGKMLDNSLEVSCIGCAAPNLRENPSNSMNPNAGNKVSISDNDLLNLLIERYRRVVALAERENIEVLILGAIGCGAFQNKPFIAATAWKKALELNGGNIKEIIFAIYCNSKDTTNYDTFARILK